MISKYKYLFVIKLPIGRMANDVRINYIWFLEPKIDRKIN